MPKVILELPEKTIEQMKDLWKYGRKFEGRELISPSLDTVMINVVEEAWMGHENQYRKDVRNHKKLQKREHERKLKYEEIERKANTSKDKLLEVKLINDLQAYRSAFYNSKSVLSAEETRNKIKDLILKIKENNPNISLVLEEFIETGKIKTKKGKNV